MSALCVMFGMSKQAYYKHVKQASKRTMAWRPVKASVLNMRRCMPRLGAKKLHYLLREEGVSIGRDHLFDLLREEDLLVKKKKKYVRTTNSTGWMRLYPNLAKDITVNRPEQLWVADITYLDTLSDGHVYLHLVTDAYSKQIMGYELCNNMNAVSTDKALQMALKERIYKESPLIHHSDRGLQYCSELYTNRLKQNGIAISTTQTGSPYDNAVAERINGILKDEFGLGEPLSDLKEALKQTKQSIFTYNHLRPHLSCRMLTPKQMHLQKTIKIKSYKRQLTTINNQLN